MDAIDIIVLMIGDDLSIRHYTPNAERVMRLIPTDIGRPLADIKTTLDLLDLERIVREVMRTMRVEEREVRDRDGHWYTMRVRPYRTSDNRIDGTVVTFAGIDAIRTSRELLRETEGALRTLLDDVPDFILSVEPLGRILFVNRTQLSIAARAGVGENFFEFLDASEHDVARHCLERVVASGEPGQFRTRLRLHGATGTRSGTGLALTRVQAIKPGGVVTALTVTTARAPATGHST